jgi:hypothetical protein
VLKPRRILVALAILAVAGGAVAWVLSMRSTFDAKKPDSEIATSDQPTIGAFSLVSAVRSSQASGDAGETAVVPSQDLVLEVQAQGVRQVFVFAMSSPPDIDNKSVVAPKVTGTQQVKIHLPAKNVSYVLQAGGLVEDRYLLHWQGGHFNGQPAVFSASSIRVMAVD